LGEKISPHRNAAAYFGLIIVLPLAVSIDGTHWVKIANLAGRFTNGTSSLDTLIAQAATAAGSTDRSNVRIKFQQYDDDPWSTDGRAFENPLGSGDP
jgi:hypothetical protein